VTVTDIVRAEVARRGPIPFAEVVELALYDAAHGFYATGGAAGRRGDFITSPEIGPLYGAVIARALDTWWREMGEPDPYVVVDAGAGPGTLARTVLAARPACAAVLRYVLVERSAPQRARHGEHLELEAPAFAFAPDGEDAERPVAPAEGPICISLAELPVLSRPAVVIANELLDNLAFGLAERAADGWHDVLVGAGDDGALREVLVPADAATAAVLERVAPDAAAGGRAPLQRDARRWLRDALALAHGGGRVIAIDYCSTTADMVCRPMTDWLRTYRAHRHGTSPLEDLGAQDITCEVAVDQLALVRQPTADRSQADFLRAHGIDELVEQGRAVWEASAARPDVAALTARSRGTEARALLDPAGLGAFRVLEWTS
jgi:SAM-dependent MidA family methyltransferase